MSDRNEARILAELPGHHARLRPGATAMVHGDRTTSYATFDRHARQVASGLASLGVKHQDRIGYLGKNSDLFLELLIGASWAGVVPVPLNWRLATPELAAILADAGIGTLFVGPGFAEVAVALGEHIRLNFIAMDGAYLAWPDFAAWRNAQSANIAPSAGPEDTVLQIYTSGTTGVAKGVELTNRNILAQVTTATAGGVGAIDPDDVVLMCMPASHVAGTLVGLFGMAHGAAVVVMAEFDPATLVQIIPSRRVTWLVLVPAAILMLVQHPASAAADFSSVRTLAYGASPIAEALVEQARVAFPNAGLWHLYGLTEVGGGCTILPPEAHVPALGKLRSCGKPYPGTELRIVDALGQPVPPGTVGEIVVRSATVMKGYWRNPEATRASFFPDGWLRTGDAAWMDPEGYVFVYDRVKDMIVSGGENVYPAEVENALFGHPVIADVAVIGVPDPRWGEAVKAIVVPKPGQTVSEADIIAHAGARIASFKAPKSIDFVDALPRNAAGKVLRRTLRAPYWEGRDRQVN